ncbi:hypothetical protein [Flavobacterium hydatis]|jgi:ABC-type xylose transport system permease subunit|uniref:Uncharacterized protein n=1 Tax=Flavobacterium hydatis TaxID=991 RepID=A0A086A4V8_FLAHY|nr:hypothetical protein [Flavobacterium hydatis]KFF11722.1 hypothetical protein IW20_19125 [Flavobacterium hydatis]OXA88432.1 hypothetical protein B0A62_22130 [Flavobacterium hydatis]
MLNIAPLILIILPVLFQLIVGTKVIFDKKPTKLKFGRISLMSFIFQMIFSVAAIFIANYNLSKYFDQHPNTTRCGMPFLGVIFGVALLFIVLCFIIFLQFLIKKWRERKVK